MAEVCRDCWYWRDGTCRHGYMVGVDDRSRAATDTCQLWQPFWRKYGQPRKAYPRAMLRSWAVGRLLNRRIICERRALELLAERLPKREMQYAPIILKGWRETNMKHMRTECDVHGTPAP